MKEASTPTVGVDASSNPMNELRLAERGDYRRFIRMNTETIEVISIPAYKLEFCLDQKSYFDLFQFLGT